MFCVIANCGFKSMDFTFNSTFCNNAICGFFRLTAFCDDFKPCLTIHSPINYNPGPSKLKWSLKVCLYDQCVNPRPPHPHHFPACASTFFGYVLMQMCMQLTWLWSFRMLGIDVSASNKIVIHFDNASTWETFWSALCPVPHQTSSF